MLEAALLFCGLSGGVYQEGAKTARTGGASGNGLRPDREVNLES